ncbi:hypothetical protein QYF61_003844 [Mycteria americana]|uniref:Uncharacterized protein n=1 Tax=Mycteria americana TaxID=33587 RepID=A0AAN7SFF0_MYCAM|nr:hypothetical protein QYF61_003844 [Mycteria americana]
MQHKRKVWTAASLARSRHRPQWKGTAPSLFLFPGKKAGVVGGSTRLKRKLAQVPDTSAARLTQGLSTTLHCGLGRREKLEESLSLLVFYSFNMQTRKVANSQSKTAIQSTLDKLVEFTSRNHMKFNNNKYKVLHSGQNQTLATAQSGNCLPTKGPKHPGAQTEHESDMPPYDNKVNVSRFGLLSMRQTWTNWNESSRRPLRHLRGPTMKVETEGAGFA